MHSVDLRCSSTGTLNYNILTLCKAASRDCVICRRFMTIVYCNKSGQVLFVTATSTHSSPPFHPTFSSFTLSCSYYPVLTPHTVRHISLPVRDEAQSNTEALVGSIVIFCAVHDAEYHGLSNTMQGQLS